MFPSSTENCDPLATKGHDGASIALSQLSTWQAERAEKMAQKLLINRTMAHFPLLLL